MTKKTAVQPDIDLIQSEKVDIALIDNNEGQIPGVKKNPREMTEMEFKKLKQSLKKRPEYTAISELRLFPFQGRYITIGGNMRLQVMKALGWKKAIGKVLPEDTPKEKLNEWILLDNANYGRWDFEELANNWDEDLLTEMNIDIPDLPDPEEEEEAKDDHCDPSALAPAVPVSKLGDIWQLGNHRLIVGDSTQSLYLEALMGDELADCIITDPPPTTLIINQIAE